MALQRLLGVWDYLVDSKVGIISEIKELPTEEDDPRFVHYLSRAADTSAFSRLRNFAANGGVSTNRRVAVAKALGEGIERYCSAIFSYHDLTFASFTELRQPATHPESFALYHPRQFEDSSFCWRPFTADTRVAWIPATSLRTGEQVFVPAAMVYAPYQYVKDGPDAPIVQPISTGLACGCSFHETAISALCEVAERDAFMLMWQLRLSRPLIEPATLPPVCRDLLQRFRSVGIDVHLVDITTDVEIPTIVSVGLSPATNSPALAIAAASDPAPAAAVTKSLEELAHTRKYAKQIMRHTPPVTCDVARGHPDVTDQRQHLRFYCPQPARALAEFVWSSSERRAFSDIVDRTCGTTRAAELASIVESFLRLGFEPVLCDLTTPDIRDLGLYVMRAVVPGMQPLFMGYRNRALGGKRLHAVAQTQGCRAHEGCIEDNPYPHPFP